MTVIILSLRLDSFDIIYTYVSVMDILVLLMASNIRDTFYAAIFINVWGNVSFLWLELTRLAILFTWSIFYFAEDIHELGGKGRVALLSGWGGDTLRLFHKSTRSWPLQIET
jgi:hypothetical protein